MNPVADRPNLRRIGATAFKEVLGELLSSSATADRFPSRGLRADAASPITSSVPLKGQRISGRVQIILPRGFLAHAVRLLTGADHAGGDVDAAQVDAAGEIANMVAGRVASRLGAEGYPCRLGTPSVSRAARPSAKPRPGADCVRSELVCAGHCLSIELRCRYLVA